MKVINRMCVYLAIVLSIYPAVAPGQEHPLPAEIRTTIDRGITFLLQDAEKWRREHQCATCHHGTLTVFALAEAQQAGFSIPPQTLAETTAWTKERLSKIDEPRDTRPGWKMVNTPAIYLGLLGRLVPEQSLVSSEELRRIRDHLLRHQEENGSWAWSSAPAANRPPPFFESDEVATLLVLLALPADEETTSDESIRAELNSHRQRAIAWLTTADATDTTQAALLRMLWRKRSQPATDLQPSIERFFARQRSDGGFAQVADRASDAYATGQAIYFLNGIGVPASRPEIARAVRFLMTTQRDDGSWPMLRRSHEGITPTDNVVPITYFGSVWATLGLIKSSNRE